MRFSLIIFNYFILYWLGILKFFQLLYKNVIKTKKLKLLLLEISLTTKLILI